ncbi:MAG TPA: hypothetical protein VGD18_04945, partial [Thiobacillaceae bacterium]
MLDLRWQPQEGLIRGRVRGQIDATASATVTTNRDGFFTLVDGWCTCPRQDGCAHPAALVLQLAMTDTGRPVPGQPTSSRISPNAKSAAWEKVITALVPAQPQRQAEPGADAELGLQFELAGSSPSQRVAMRPVVPGRAGWVRSGVAWSTLGYARFERGSAAERHRGLLNEILMLSMAGADRHYYGYHQQPVYLDAFQSRRIWDLLAEAQEAGLPLIQSGKAATPVTVSRPARMTLRAERDEDDLVLVPSLTVADVTIASGCSVLVGHPAHGVVWWATDEAGTSTSRQLRLSPLAELLTPSLVQALTGPQIRIPEQDKQRFLRDYYPRLLRQVEIVAPAGVIDLPTLGPSILTLAVGCEPGPELALEWLWTQSIGDDVHSEPLYSTPPAHQADPRDSLVAQVAALVRRVPELLEQSASGQRLAPSARLNGDAMVRLLTDVVPLLEGRDDVNVEWRSGEGDPPFREINEPPVISFFSGGVDGGVDWFD